MENDTYAKATQKLMQYNEPPDFTPIYALKSILKSSLGPRGMDKLISDQFGDFIITNDGATILKNLPIVHAPARVLIDIAMSQDKRIGDGTTTVVLLACELISHAERLMNMGIHPMTIVDGYILATSKATELLTSRAELPAALQIRDVSEPDDVANSRVDARMDFLCKIATTSLCSKSIGPFSDHFAPIAVKSIDLIQDTTAGKLNFDLNRIRFQKVVGGRVDSSSLVSGHVIGLARALPPGMPQKITGARLLIIDFWVKPKSHEISFEATNLRDARKLEESNSDEEKLQAMRVVRTGANLLVTNKPLSNIAIQTLSVHKVMVVHNVNDMDLQNIAVATGTTVVSSLVQFNEEKEKLGSAALVEQVCINGTYLVYIICQNPKSCTILLRGPSLAVIDEIERALHDAQCVIARMLENPLVLPGGGACEMAVAIHLQNLAINTKTKQKFILEAFASSLLFLPHALLTNAGFDPIEIIAELRRAHETNTNMNGFWSGINLETGKVEDMMALGVLEPCGVKTSALSLAVEAACTLIKASRRS
eukprot:Phypoly_transcript_04079.p1 GENE.Phypoly_transcript_04079~~Phypoly_transcript_04079.p1  ORF type:complete len:538 (+),score=85.04 Phypoly_transcript_04079:122-1735(+)